MELFNSDCADTLWFIWIVQSTWKMALTNNLIEVHKRRSEISLGINSKRCADSSEW